MLELAGRAAKPAARVTSEDAAGVKRICRECQILAANLSASASVLRAWQACVLSSTSGSPFLSRTPHEAPVVLVMRPRAETRSSCPTAGLVLSGREIVEMMVGGLIRTEEPDVSQAWPYLHHPPLLETAPWALWMACCRPRCANAPSRLRLTRTPGCRSPPGLGGGLDADVTRARQRQGPDPEQGHQGLQPGGW